MLSHGLYEDSCNHLRGDPEPSNPIDETRFAGCGRKRASVVLFAGRAVPI
jgi:hypothetical protein